MNAAIVYVHPYNKSYNYAVLEHVKDGLKENNEDFKMIDLVADHFNPVMSVEDLSTYNKGISKDELVMKYQRIINSSKKLIFIFPIWWGGDCQLFSKVFLIRFF